MLHDSCFMVREQGFTLIEMIVSMGIFAVVITMAMSAFLNISNIQNKAMAVRAVNDNLNFAIEAMMREIRTGNDYSSDGVSFSFVGSNDCLTKFALQNNRITKEVISGSGCTVTIPLDMTSGELTISTLIFILDGENVADGQQPRVTVIVTGSSGIKERARSELKLQTTVTQRQIDS